MHVEEPLVTYREMEDHTRVDVLVDGRSVSHLVVIPLTIHIGRATVVVDGIGDVWTEEAHRGQGYARRLIEEMVRVRRR